MTISKPAHRIILNGFRYAEPIWQLECLHDNNDPEWHTYYSEHAINHGQQYHEECVAIKFWNKEGAELIVDTNNFLAVPFDVDAKWVMDDLKLVPRTSLNHKILNEWEQTITEWKKTINEWENTIDELEDVLDKLEQYEL